ncbi:MAG TPA: CDP-glucose 4,6-dehydratase [Candidatus Baltobacteraceae bacterium]
MRSRRIFVTGHTGFKGSWLSLWLLHLGATVRGYALAPDLERSLFDLVHLQRDMESIIGDVRDAETVDSAVDRFGPELIMHLAAQPLVARGYSHARETFETNVMGTVNILEAARRSRTVRAIVVVTTDKVYRETLPGESSVETDPLGGRDPYSASKACAEMVALAYRESFLARRGVVLATARAGNILGGGDRAEHRIAPDIVRAWTAAHPVVVRNPGAVRPWQHVLDALNGYLVLGERALEGDARVADAWNFGPPIADSVPVARLVEIFQSKWPGAPGWAPSTDAATFTENPWLGLDAGKARTILGWKPRYEIDAAVEATIAWYRAELNGADVRDFSLRQIDDFTRVG